MGADDHNAPGRPVCAGAAAAEDGPQRRARAGPGGSKMPNARAEVIPNTGHLAFLEAPREIRRAVARLPRQVMRKDK